MEVKKLNQHRNCIYIPSIDAKDLYLANNQKNTGKKKVGYKLVTKTGDIPYNRFIKNTVIKLSMSPFNIAVNVLTN